LSIIKKSVGKVQVLITGTFHKDKYTLLIISRSVLLRMLNISNKFCKENLKTYILYSITCFQTSWLLWDDVEEYSRAKLATEDNMTHAHCMLEN